MRPIPAKTNRPSEIQCCQIASCVEMGITSVERWMDKYGGSIVMMKIALVSFAAKLHHDQVLSSATVDWHSYLPLFPPNPRAPHEE